MAHLNTVPRALTNMLPQLAETAVSGEAWPR
jgi:hypothetical protein